MIPIAMITVWAGYGVATWGYALIKGWDIPFGQWFNPLHPWEWTADNAASPPQIPASQVNPSASPKTVKPPASA